MAPGLGRQWCRPPTATRTGPARLVGFRVAHRGDGTTVLHVRLVPQSEVNGAIEDARQQRYALPDEISPAVVFLASDAASFVTCTVLVIDGGYTVY